VGCHPNRAAVERGGGRVWCRNVRCVTTCRTQHTRPAKNHSTAQHYLPSRCDRRPAQSLLCHGSDTCDTNSETNWVWWIKCTNPRELQEWTSTQAPYRSCWCQKTDPEWPDSIRINEQHPREHLTIVGVWQKTRPSAVRKKRPRHTLTVAPVPLPIVCTCLSDGCQHHRCHVPATTRKCCWSSSAACAELWRHGPWTWSEGPAWVLYDWNGADLNWFEHCRHGQRDCARDWALQRSRTAEDWAFLAGEGLEECALGKPSFCKRIRTDTLFHIFCVQGRCRPMDWSQNTPWWDDQSEHSPRPNQHTWLKVPIVCDPQTSDEAICRDPKGCTCPALTFACPGNHHQNQTRDLALPYRWMKMQQSGASKQSLEHQPIHIDIYIYL